VETRELGILEIIDRLKTYKDVLGLKTFKRSPTTPISETNLPCVFLHEDIDEIIKESGRGGLGYPATRTLEVVLEIVTGGTADVRQLYLKVRAAVLKDGCRIAPNTFIKEIRTEGPTGYGLPDVLGMKLVFALTYQDEGINIQL